MTVSLVVNQWLFSQTLLLLIPNVGDSLVSLTIVHAPHTGHFICLDSQKLSCRNTHNETNTRCPLSHVQRIGVCMRFGRVSSLHPSNVRSKRCHRILTKRSIELVFQVRRNFFQNIVSVNLHIVVLMLWFLDRKSTRLNSSHT